MRRCRHLGIPTTHDELAPGFLEALLNEAHGTRFLFRRDPAIRLRPGESAP